MTTLLMAEVLWECPRCKATDVTRGPKLNRFHNCPAMGGLTAPMVEANTRVKVTIVEREDYVGDETVTSVDGRPIMSVVTEREDGSNDVVVYAPAAKGGSNGR